MGVEVYGWPSAEIVMFWARKRDVESGVVEVVLLLQVHSIARCEVGA